MITPDRYAILHYLEQDQFAILSGWSGGYLDGDSWRRSSAIQSVKFTQGGYEVQTGSSTYFLRDGSAGVTGLSASIWGQIESEQQRQGKNMVDIWIDEDDIESIFRKHFDK